MDDGLARAPTASERTTGAADEGDGEQFQFAVFYIDAAGPLTRPLLEWLTAEFGEEFVEARLVSSRTDAVALARLSRTSFEEHAQRLNNLPVGPTLHFGGEAGPSHVWAAMPAKMFTCYLLEPPVTNHAAAAAAPVQAYVEIEVDGAAAGQADGATARRVATELGRRDFNVFPFVAKVENRDRVFARVQGEDTRAVSDAVLRVVQNIGGVRATRTFFELIAPALSFQRREPADGWHGEHFHEQNDLLLTLQMREGAGGDHVVALRESFSPQDQTTIEVRPVRALAVFGSVDVMAVLPGAHVGTSHLLAGVRAGNYQSGHELEPPHSLSTYVLRPAVARAADSTAAGRIAIDVFVRKGAGAAQGKLLQDLQTMSDAFDCRLEYLAEVVLRDRFFMIVSGTVPKLAELVRDRIRGDERVGYSRSYLEVTSALHSDRDSGAIASEPGSAQGKKEKNKRLRGAVQALPAGAVITDDMISAWQREYGYGRRETVVKALKNMNGVDGDSVPFTRRSLERPID